MRQRYQCEECDKRFIAEPARKYAEELPCPVEDCDGTASKVAYRFNREILADLVEDADDMTLVFLRERLAYVCEMYADADKIRAEWGASMVSPELYINAAAAVKKELGFDEEGN